MARKNTNKTRPRRAGALRGVTGALAVIPLLLVRALAPLRPLGAAAWKHRATRRLAGLAAGSAVCGVLAWVMLGHLRAQENFQIDPGRIELAAEPSWARPELAARVKAQIEQQLRAELSAQPAGDVFDTEMPVRLAAGLERSPWVRSVLRIERRFPDATGQGSRLQPVLEIRRPALAVETGGQFVLVDGEGVVLPLNVGRTRDDLAAFCMHLRTPLRLVKGVRSHAPRPGQMWRSEQVAAAISMEQVLRRADIDKAMPIEAIELVGVPERADARGRVHYASDGFVMLWPDQARFPGTQLIWGRPPVHASTLEAGPTDKLSLLKQKLDAPESLAGARIDLRKRA